MISRSGHSRGRPRWFGSGMRGSVRAHSASVKSVSKEPEQVRVHNPVVRIPALLLDDGDVLVESYAILDEIDQMVGPERVLTPASGRRRREVMKITAIALASMEKAQWAF